MLSVTFEPLTLKNLDQLKILNSVIFPIKYQDNLYKDCLLFEDLTQGAFCDGELVGAITVRLERLSNGKARLYLVTLGVLAAYRDSGIGSKLLQRTLEKAQEDPNIVEACLHVQTSNEEAIQFYQRFGFGIAETLKDYYRKNRLDPPDAYLLSKSLVSQILSGNGVHTNLVL